MQDRMKLWNATLSLSTLSKCKPHTNVTYKVQGTREQTFKFSNRIKECHWTTTNSLVLGKFGAIRDTSQYQDKLMISRSPST